jgi:hypothetical protein
MTLNTIVAMVSNPAKRARMATIALLENELTDQAEMLEHQFADGISNEREVQRAVRVQIDLWTDEHGLNQQERLHLFQLAHRVAKVPQF